MSTVYEILFSLPRRRVFAGVRIYLNLDICCVRGVNSLRRGSRRASFLWEGANPLSLATLASSPEEGAFCVCRFAPIKLPLSGELAKPSGFD